MKPNNISILLKKDFYGLSRLIVLQSLPLFLLTIIFGFATNKMINIPYIYSLYTNIIPSSAAVVLSFVITYYGIYMEKEERIAEMILTTSLKPVEFLVAKWLLGFISGTIGSYLLLIIYVFLSFERYQELNYQLFWIRPVLISIVFASVGTIIGINSLEKNLVKKLVKFFIVLGIPFGFFLLMMLSVTGLLVSIQENIFNSYIWPTLVMYVVICLILAKKGLDIYNFI